MPIKKPIAKKKEKKSISDVTDFSVRTINPEIKYFEGKDSTYLVFRFISTNSQPDSERDSKPAWSTMGAPILLWT